MDISVVLSTYNRVEVLPRALESLLDQDRDGGRYEIEARRLDLAKHRFLPRRIRRGAFLVANDYDWLQQTADRAPGILCLDRVPIDAC